MFLKCKGFCESFCVNETCIRKEKFAFSIENVSVYKHGLRLKGNETVMAFIHLHYRVYIYLNTIATDQFSESWRIMYALQGISVCQKYYITIICE